MLSHRSHFETLQYKQRVKKDLEEDLHLLSDGLNEAEGHRERTIAELELQESNRLQLQKVKRGYGKNRAVMISSCYFSINAEP